MRPDKPKLILVVLFAVMTQAALANTWYVNGATGNDSDNCKSPTTACKTIAHAISLAASGDSIRVAAATYTENLTISISLKIIGASAATTIIDGGGVSTVVTISSTNANVALSGVTITNGVGEGTYNIGGGIYNIGTLTINQSAISGNTAGSEGGGIFSSGTLTINNSTISGNKATRICTGRVISCLAYGGGIGNYGTLTINNSTISRNSAVVTCSLSCGIEGAAEGGGISNYRLSSLQLNSTTVSGNSASLSGCFKFCVALGGIENANNLGGMIFQNSILADNSHGNCLGNKTSNGYNLSSDNTCAFDGPGDLNNTDPQLGPLQNNGGPTQTQALLSGSPAIDAGNPSGCTDGSGHLLKTDQRGMPRPDKEDSGGCDMGAYERQSD